MTILDQWREAVECIAEANDEDTTAAVQEARDDFKRVQDKLQARLARKEPLSDDEEKRIRADQRSSEERLSQFFDARLKSLRTTQPDALAKLTEFVVYLVWIKLRGNASLESECRTLYTKDLKAWLNNLYADTAALKVVSAWTSNPFYGDLRKWLCAWPGRRALYTHRTVDLHLLEVDLENIAWNTPPEVITDIHKTHRDSADRKRALEDWRLQPKSELVRHVPRGIPLSIYADAIKIAHELATGSCDCVAWHDATHRLRIAACARCHDYHFLSKANVAAAKTGDLTQQKKPMTDSLEYVVRAVIEAYHQDLQGDGFAFTMLANHFVTPRGGRLRSYLCKGKSGPPTYTLCDSSLEVPSASDLTFAADYDNAVGELVRAEDWRACLFCPTCRTFAGGKRRAKKGPCDHPLQYGKLGPEVSGEFFEAKVNVCPAGHSWLSDSASAICPLCDLQASRLGVEVEVFIPTESSAAEIDAVEWQWQLPLGPNAK